MRRVLALSFIVVVLTAGLMSGCKDGVPQSDLEMFIVRTAEFEGQALQDTLRQIAAGEPPYNGYANFILGNGFYNSASDSARYGGWSNQGAQALLDSAEVYFSLAVAQDSTFIEPMVNLGSIWDDRAETIGNRQQYDERLAEAKKFYNMALAVDPGDEKARCNLGSLYLRQRRTSEALAEFEKTLEYNPESSLAHYNIAIMFAEAKIYREALAEWELASKYDPDGDIGDRSRENIKIVHDLMNAPTPPIGK
ncbi:MAG: tetratricopeptide repeat protein [Candidatus Krumholzibacteria bacterium]|nr:tetratricopeptide repeat protein [Candidatus Krumholzibacteria bacterium]